MLNIRIGRPATASASSSEQVKRNRGDLLLNAVIGLGLSAAALYAGSPYLLHTVDQSNTDQTATLFSDIAHAIVSYYHDVQSMPTTLTALVPTYLSATPADPIAPAATNISITPYGPNNNQYILKDTQAHEPNTLQRYAKGTGTGGAAPTRAGCVITQGGTGCTLMMYDPAFGVEAM